MPTRVRESEERLQSHQQGGCAEENERGGCDGSDKEHGREQGVTTKEGKAQATKAAKLEIVGNLVHNKYFSYLERKEMRSESPAPSSPSSASLRLWKPAAQRNLRNQWSKMLASKDRWVSASSEGRSHANALVNAHLSQRYMLDMDLGALKDMPGIQQKACKKLAQKQELYCCKLLSSYKEMVVSVCHLVKASNSFRCFIRGSVVSSIMQFSDCPEDNNDFGDGGGIPVFSSFTVSYYENLAKEVVDMFLLEISLKRLLVVELLSTYQEKGRQTDTLSWANELYPGEFDDLRTSSLLSEDSFHPIPPGMKDWQLSNPSTWKSNHPLKREVLQVYLTTWLADVNIEMNRINEIFSMVEEEMQVKLS